MTRPYLRDVVNDHKAPMKVNVHLPNKVTEYESKFGQWKSQLKMQINFIFSKNFYETRTIHSVSNSIEIFMGEETDNIIDELFEFLLQGYQKAKEESNKKESEFVSESVDLMYYHLHKIILRRGK